MTIRAAAFPCSKDDADAFDLRTLTLPAALLKDETGEELAIRCDSLTVRLSLASGSLLDGPVCLDFHLHGRVHLQRRLLALGQLEALMRLGRIPSAQRGKNRQVARPALLLRTLDALATTTGIRSVATELFGAGTVATGWDHASDYLRSQTRRLIARARRLAAGAYLDLLQ